MEKLQTVGGVDNDFEYREKSVQVAFIEVF